MVDKPIVDEEGEDNEGIIPSAKDLVGKTVEIVTARRSWKGKVVKYDDRYKIVVIRSSQGLYTVRLRNVISFGILK